MPYTEWSWVLAVEHERPLAHRVTPDSGPPSVLSDAQITQFIHDDFVKIPGAFPRELADHGRPIAYQGEEVCGSPKR